MRTLVVLLSLACAHKNPNQPEAPPMDAVQVRACESCRHNLQMCTEHLSRADTNTSGTRNAECMEQFMACLNAQQLDHARCQGMN